jgi:hypothetical protein
MQTQAPIGCGTPHVAFFSKEDKKKLSKKKYIVGACIFAR